MTDTDETIIKNLLTSIRDKFYDKAINYLYDNIDTIVKNINKYHKLLKNKEEKPMDVSQQYADEELGRYMDMILRDENKVTLLLFCKIYRICVQKLIEIKHKLKLLEEKEVKKPRTKITYVITIADDEVKTKLFILYILNYHMESFVRAISGDKNKINSKAHVGIDYEFNNRIIALMQLNFETVSSPDHETNSYIWISNPGEFDDKKNKILIDYLMLDPNIYRILHGPDSLDIPYMYSTMFKDDKDTIVKFTSKVIDTRFLCEYFRLSIDDGKKCSIYDALLYFETISKEKHKWLEDTHELMGPVQDVNWNIHKMSSFHVQYALYDVLYLKHFLFDIYERIQKKTPQNITPYRFVMPLIRFNYLERREVMNTMETAKEEINPLNNYLIKYKGQNITLITIYNQVIENMKIPYCPDDNYIDIDFIFLVTYVKKSLSVLLKKIIYHIILENYTVYKNKNEKYHGKLPLDEMYKELKDYNQKRMILLFNLFHNEAENKILTLYKI